MRYIGLKEEYICRGTILILIWWCDRIYVHAYVFFILSNDKLVFYILKISNTCDFSTILKFLILLHAWILWWIFLVWMLRVTLLYLLMWIYLFVCVTFWQKGRVVIKLGYIGFKGEYSIHGGSNIVNLMIWQYLCVCARVHIFYALKFEDITWVCFILFFLMCKKFGIILSKDGFLNEIASIAIWEYLIMYMWQNITKKWMKKLRKTSIHKPMQVQWATGMPIVVR